MPRVYLPDHWELTTNPVDMGGTTQRLGTMIEELEAQYPGVAERILRDGKIAPWLSIAVDGELVPKSLLLEVGPTSEVHFIPAIAGG